MGEIQMFRWLAIATACVLAAACTTTDTRLAKGLGSPPAGATILLVKPDVDLALLTASGLSEARADWTQQGTVNLQSSIERALASSSHKITPVNPEDVIGGRTGQLMRLHEAVGQSIISYEYGPYRLPTKKDGFAWTLGDGAQTLAEQYHADYALFTYGHGTYASGGRIATMVALSVIGVGIPLGSQQAFVSLVDLRTGQVIWFNMAVAGPQADMRSVEGADSLVASLLTDAPL
jgi:hypothetical protein